MAINKTTGTFVHLIHSPDGGVEGLLMESHGEVVQYALRHGEDAQARLIGSLAKGQSLDIGWEEASEPRKKKVAAAHPVRLLARIAAVDGKRPQSIPTPASGYVGEVARLNYARHGEPNGFFLDTGDFIHVRPEGFAKLGLNVGDMVRAQGDAQWLSTGGGWAVEAAQVNGKTLRQAPALG